MRVFPFCKAETAVDALLSKLIREHDFDGYYHWTINRVRLEIFTCHRVITPPIRDAAAGVWAGVATFGGGVAMGTVSAEFNLADPEFLDKVLAWIKLQHLERSS